MLSISFKICHLSFTCCILLFIGCKPNNPPGMVGQWNAQWTMSSSELTRDLSPENLNMSGNITFFNDNTAMVTAHGYKGCLFCSDTITNKLTWELNDSTLTMINTDYDFTLEYKIQNRTDASIELLLMEDIIIKLNRE